MGGMWGSGGAKMETTVLEQQLMIIIVQDLFCLGHCAREPDGYSEQNR